MGTQIEYISVGKCRSKVVVLLGWLIVSLWRKTGHHLKVNMGEEGYKGSREKKVSKVS